MNLVLTSRQAATQLYSIDTFAMIFITFVLVLSFRLTVTAQKEQVTLLFVGDISFSGPVKYYVEHNYHSYNDSFRDVAPFIREADISIANLESPFVSKDVYRCKYKGRKGAYLDSSPEAVSALSFAGFDVVTVANNHLYDFTSKGANFTVQVLKGGGIKYFGISYGTLNSSQEPLIMTKNGIRIGFLGYCEFETDFNFKNCSEMRLLFNSGPAVYRDAIATRDVEKLKKANVDVIVVYMHWSKELSLEPLPRQLHITKHLVSLGVQVIIGSHPHVLQPHCIHGNKLIAYSLGNFLFPPSRTPGGNDPTLYGKPGVKPDEQRIKAYESYALEHCENFKLSRMLQVTVTRNGVLAAKYFPLRIEFDHKTKRLHPEPTENAKWIDVCGNEDKHCQKCYKN